MLTADPRVVESPRVVPQLSFDEASELAYFGAKVLHPSTILPAVGLGIPVRILNSHRPEAKGTLITSRAEPERRRAGRDRLQARRDARRHRLLAHADGVRLPAPRLRGVRAFPDAGGRGHHLGGERLGDDRRPARARRDRRGAVDLRRRLLRGRDGDRVCRRRDAAQEHLPGDPRPRRARGPAARDGVAGRLAQEHHRRAARRRRQGRDGAAPPQVLRGRRRRTRASATSRGY